MSKICCGGFNIGEGLELDGKTLKATGGSGSEDFVVKFNIGLSGVTADKTVEEVIAALTNGVLVKAILHNSGAVAYFSSNSGAFVFSEIVPESNIIYGQVVGASEEGWVYAGEFSYALTPAD